MDLFAPANARGADRSGSTRVEDMGSEDFLALLIAPMKHQDPTQPMDQMPVYRGRYHQQARYDRL